MPRHLADRERVLRSIPEADWQRTVIEAARVRGFKVYATRRSGFRMADGTSRTVIEADGKGFPDLLCVHPTEHRIVMVENKKETAQPTLEQEQWMQWLAAVPGVRCWVLRPSDADELETVFGKGA